MFWVRWAIRLRRCSSFNNSIYIMRDDGEMLVDICCEVAQVMIMAQLFIDEDGMKCNELDIGWW